MHFLAVGLTPSELHGVGLQVRSAFLVEGLRSWRKIRSMAGRRVARQRGLT